MSCNLHVYVGAAAYIEKQPEGDFDAVYDLTDGHLLTVCNGNEERLRYALPNRDGAKYGMTFDSHSDEPKPFAVTPERIDEAVKQFYDDYRESLFRLTNAGFRLTVEYVVLSYWM